MEIRPAQLADLGSLSEIDGTIESTHYLHIERAGEGMSVSFKIEQRPLRTKLVERNRPRDEEEFLLKQILSGIDEGVAILAEHDDQKVALLVAQPSPQTGTMRVADLRVDYDFRRQGLATAMLFQVIAEARARELRAVTAESRANNIPLNQLLEKLGFELAGLDTHRHSNHDLVKESATLLWYAPLP